MSEQEHKTLENAKAEKPAEKKENFFVRAGKGMAKWFRELKSEAKKVVWPNAKTLRNNVFVSIGMMLVSAVAIWVFDGVASMLVKGIFTFLG